MLTLDYFLYDNRTWTAGVGRDWGVKSATGVLASRDDLRWLFERYCAMLCGDRGYLGGFGRALGGIRPRSGPGYLLCATVETSDPFGRPSWAVYGLWCPDPQTLERALAVDAIGAAEAALRFASPLAAIAMSTALSPPVPLRLVAGTPLFRRFDADAAPAEVRAILLGAMRQQQDLPAILGVTASSRLAAAGEEFDILYCHPLDERAQQVFDQVRSDDDSVFELLQEERTPAIAPLANKSHPSYASRVALATGLALLAALIAFKSSAVQRELALRHAALQVAAIRALDPRELRGVADRRDDRAVRKACAELIEQWERITAWPHDGSPDWTAHARPLSGQPCHVLQMAYPADFRNPRSAARQWCDSLAKLERTAKTLRSLSGTTRAS